MTGQDDDDDKSLASKAKRKGTCCYCCFVCCTYVLTTIGAMVIVCTYIALGGALFQWLERNSDLPTPEQMKTIDISNVADNLWSYTKTLSHNQAAWRKATEIMLYNYRLSTYNVTVRGWKGEALLVDPCQGDETVCQKTQWSYFGSAFFSAALVTTIGYGNIVPKTENGRIITMAYSTLGIPIALICFACIGKALAHALRWIILQCWRCCDCKHCCCCCCWCCVNERNRPNHGDYDEPFDVDEIRIPLTIATTLLYLYVFIGSSIWGEWKDDWDFVVSSYFCFITLSTVGFGDFYLESNYTPGIIVFSMIYILFGLSLLAMCFELLASEIEYKFVDTAIITGMANDEDAVADDSDYSDED